MQNTLKVILFGIFSLLVLSACQNTSAPTPINGSDSNEVDVNLSNGNILEFAYEKEIDSVLVVESGDDHNASAISTLTNNEDGNDDELTALDIFWAFSTPGTPVPTFLTDKYGTPSGNQGWGIELLANEATEDAVELAHANTACNDASFLLALISHLRSTNPFVKLNKKPSNYSSFNYYNYFGSPRYKFSYTRYVRKWYGSLCGRSVQTTSNNHYINGFYYGPILKWKYYSNGWKTWKSHVIPANSTRWYHYYWDSTSRYSKNVTIERARYKDQFDIAVDGKW